VLGEDVLADAISDVFTSVYMTALAREGLVPLGNNRAEFQSGVLEVVRMRLIVVYWVAYIIVLVLGVMLVVTTLVGKQVLRKKTLLFEEPAGLASFAGLLGGESDLMGAAGAQRKKPTFDSMLAAFMEGVEKTPTHRGRQRRRMERDAREGTDRLYLAVVKKVARPSESSNPEPTP